MGFLVGGGANLIVIGLLLGGVLCVGVSVFLVVVIVKLTQARGDEAQLAAAVKAGTVTDLLPWSSDALGALSCEWVGSSSFTNTVGGFSDQAAGRVPSDRAPSGWLLAFAMNARNRGAVGQVHAVTSAHRIEVQVASGVAEVAVNSAQAGSWRLATGELLAADGAAIGMVRRDTNASADARLGRLAVRGRNVATFHLRSESDTARAADPTSFFTDLAAPLSPEEETWALVAAVLELGWFGPRRTNASISMPV